jgi:hypothetical protein
VGEPAHGGRLALEANPVIRQECGGAVQELHRDRLAEPEPLAAIHDPHSPGGDPLRDAIPVVEDQADSRVLHGWEQEYTGSRTLW